MQKGHVELLAASTSAVNYHFGAFAALRNTSSSSRFTVCMLTVGAVRHMAAVARGENSMEGHERSAGVM